MGLKELARKFLSKGTVDSLTRAKKRIDRARVARLRPLDESDFKIILVDDLRLTTGDTVFVHSSIDRLNLNFPFYRILSLLRDVIGPQGTVLLPTYPNHRISSYEYLLEGHTFSVRKTPSYIGLLTEFARRQPDAVRSLHPTKSVCAIGPLAKELTADHQNSPYPYDKCSPYYKLVEHNGKIVGLGVWTFNLSFVYTVEDALKLSFPARTYHEQRFEVPCVNYQGQVEIVTTCAHDMNVVDTHDIPPFMKAHIASEVCKDLVINGMRFFRADAAALFTDMLRLAKEGITVYPQSVYSKEYLNESQQRTHPQTNVDGRRKN
jgi:aminoglycoside 3-N-acetyltransferase